MDRITAVNIWFVVACVGAGCEPEPEKAVNGAVLSPKQTIEATNNNGTVRISYVTQTKRKFEWDGRSRIIKMIPREEPFQGRQGLYEPAASWGLNPFEIRLVVEESIVEFENEGQIYAFLKQSSVYMDWVYTTNGLVVGFSRTPARKQINIDVWQILLRGKKANGLKGAKDQAIRLISTRG